MPDNILSKIEEDMTNAMRGKMEVELSTLRMAKAALKNAEIAKRPEKLTEDDELKVLKGEVKKHQDSIDLFQKGNRPDLVKKEEAEIIIVKKYLPKDLGDDELKKIIQNVLKKLGDDTKNFGKVMGAVMKEVAGRADGGRVGKMLKEILDKTE